MNKETFSADKRIRFKNFMLQNDEVTPLRKVYSVFLAIGLGLLLGMIPIESVDGDSVLAYEVLFNNFTNSPALLTQMLNLFATYGLLALGTAIAFKAGVLNIGATGQFLAGGCLTLLLGIEYGSQLNQGEAIIVMLVVSIVGGALVATIAALLKVYFNINEVVTTLLLNWIVFYIFKIALFDLPNYKDPSGNFTYKIGDSFSYAIGDQEYLLPILLFLGCAVLMFFIFTFTTFGLKIKACGNGFSAAKANGISVNKVFIATFALSGALCGLAGSILYAYQGRTDLGGSSLPLEGFNAIAISLLAYNQPLGVVFTSFFYSILEVGKPATNIASISPESMSLVLAIIIFFSALASIFIKARPLKWMIEFIVSRNNIEYKNLKEKYQKAKDKKSNNLIYTSSKERIKQINRVLEDRLAFEQGLIDRNKIDDKYFFNKGMKKRDDLLQQKKIIWDKYIKPVDLEISDYKTKMKLHRINYISSWYNRIPSWKLFFMRFIA